MTLPTTRPDLRQFDPVQAVIYVGYIAVMLVGCVTLASVREPFLTLYLVATVLAISIIAIMLFVSLVERFRYAHRAPSAHAMIAFFVVRVVLIEAFAWLWGDPMMTMFLYLTLALTAYGYWGKRASRWVFVGATIQFLVRETVFILGTDTLSDQVDSLLTYVVCFTVMALIALQIEIIDRERNQRARAESLLDELEQMHRRMLDVATVEERNRLARDIHDSLGHRLTVIHVQLEKALAFQHDDPAVTTQAIQDARRMARTALDDVRQSVGALRQHEAFRLCDALRVLVEEVQSIGLTVTLDMNGDESAYSQQALMTLYRVAQEGITNSRKHAHSTQVRIGASFGPTEAVLTVRDDGSGFSTAEGARGGFGLLGLRERVELLSGTLQIDSSPSVGTILRATLPRNPIRLSRQLATAEAAS